MFDVMIKNGQVIDGTGNLWFKADIVIFDPRKIIDKATYDDPIQPPEGIHYVIVNGEVVLQNGELTGAAAGRVLKYRK